MRQSRMVESKVVDRRERVIIGLMFLFFLIVNVTTADRSPTVWGDEVMFADPAINLVRGHGFTSTAWPWQPSDAPFAGNSPLYPLLLTAWLALTGISATAVRSLNYFLMIAAAVMFWKLLRRHSHAGMLWRLLAITVLLAGNGITFSYRTGRYDVLGIVLVLAGTLLWESDTISARIGLLVISGLLPWAGLQLIPMTCVGIAALLVFERPAPFKRAATAIAGMALGSAILVGYFISRATLGLFIASVTDLGGIATPLSAKVRGLPLVFISDPSGTILLLTAILLLVTGTVSDKQERRLTTAGIGLAICLPVFLYFAAKYTVAYTWAATLVLTFVIACSANSVNSRRMRRVAAAGMVAAGIVGLPLRLAVTCAQWNARDYKPVEQFVVRNIEPDDRVLTDFQAYYPAKLRVGELHLPVQIRAMTAAEKARTNVIIAVGDNGRRLAALIGGQFEQTAAYEAPKSSFSDQKWLASPYHLVILRRKSTP